MMNKKKLASLITAASTCMIVPALASAAGYGINEQSASATGAANAGAAANPENATILYFNPAGMTKLDGDQISFGATALDIGADYSARATTAVGTPVQGTDDEDFVPMAYVPNFYYTHKMNDTVSYGVGVFAPFGLKADYQNDFVGRYFADVTDLKMVDLAPSIAFDSGDGFSLGFGIDIMYAKGTLSRYQDYTGLETKFGITPGTFHEGHFEAQGDDVDIGWNIGLMYQPSDRTTVGVTYRSKVEFDLKGDATLTNVPNPVTGNVSKLTEDAHVPLTTPASLTFSLKQGLTDSLDLLAGATWTQWSEFQALDILSDQSNAGSLGTISQLGTGTYGGNGDVIGHVSENWHNTWALSLGLAWQATPSWQFKTGYAFDESPIPKQYRTARIPSTDRNWLTLGAQWKDANSGWSVDGALGYLIIRDVRVNEQEYTVENKPVAGAESFKGTYEPNAIGLGIQVSKAF